MCGRYYIDDDLNADELWSIIDTINRRSNSSDIKTSGEIAPADSVPVIASSRALKPSAFAMTWGYSLPDGKRIINARSEAAAEKPLFRDGMRQRRCAIPASHYFEWEHGGKQKTKYAIRPAGTGLMYMAGIYRIENSRPVFTILTREPADTISFIHNRMPVLLHPDMVSDWINPGSAADELLRHAILDVCWQRAAGNAPEQLGMEL